MIDDSEMLTDLSYGELDAMPEGILSPAAPSRLDELLRRNADERLSNADQSELDVLLARVDRLTLLKARARFTLLQRVAASPT